MKEKIAAFEATKGSLATVTEKTAKQPRKIKKDAEFLDDKVLVLPVKLGTRCKLCCVGCFV
jgi:hypothetical protein